MFNDWIAKIGLILATVILTVACNTQSQQKSTNQQPENLQGQILMLVELPLRLIETDSNELQNVIQESIEGFRRLYPQVHVFVEFLPQGQMWQAFESQVKRGAGPDLVMGYSDNKTVRLIQTGALRSLDGFEFDTSQFRSEALKDISYQGKLYGLPMYLSTQVLCYNKNKVKALPKTLPQLIEQARRGYSVGLHSGFVPAFWGTGVFGGRLLDDQGRVILDQGGGWAKWMEWLKQAQNEPNLILSDDAEALQQAFVEGRLAYLTCSSAWLPQLRKALGNNNLGATLLPAEANQPATPALRTGVVVFNRASSPNQTQLALQLAQFLSNVEQQKKIEATIPFIPSNQNVTVDGRLFPIRAALIDQSKTAIALSLDEAEKAQLIMDTGEILYEKVLAGQISPDQAATQLTQTVNRQLGWE